MYTYPYEYKIHVCIHTHKHPYVQCGNRAHAPHLWRRSTVENTCIQTHAKGTTQKQRRRPDTENRNQTHLFRCIFDRTGSRNTHMHMYVYSCACSYIFIFIFIYMYIYIYTYIRIYIYTHMHHIERTPL